MCVRNQKEHIYGSRIYVGYRLSLTHYYYCFSTIIIEYEYISIPKKTKQIAQEIFCVNKIFSPKSFLTNFFFPSFILFLTYSHTQCTGEILIYWAFFSNGMFALVNSTDLSNKIVGFFFLLYTSSSIHKRQKNIGCELIHIFKINILFGIFFFFFHWN